jgi:16S rRNA (guanine527-N7)-methyltransferase
MKSNDIENFLARGIELMGLHLENQDEALSRLADYFQELKKWNRKVNLVGRQQDDQVILENHFLDSLTLLPLLEEEKASTAALLDVGTGAGFPGLVVKVACPWLSTVLLEPRQNRYYFLKHIIRTLQLDGVDVLQVRLERNNQPQELRRQKFSIITSRAFSNIEVFVGLSSDLLSPDGKIICMKGPQGVKELKDFQQHTVSKEYTAELKKMYLPFSKAERILVVLKKF